MVTRRWVADVAALVLIVGSPFLVRGAAILLSGGAL